MTDDERGLYREDAQRAMAAGMRALAKATRRLKAVGMGAETTVADLREVQDGLKKVMEFNAEMLK